MANISFEDFSSNFITHVRGFEHEHTDESGTYQYGVGFNVVCTSNNRVMYFESHLGSDDVPANTTNEDVLNIAWSNVLSNVQGWATEVISAPTLYGSSYTPDVVANSNLEFTSTSNMDVSAYSSNFTTMVQRFETYPANNPSCWCVGFQVNKTSDPTIQLNVDTQVVVTTFALYKAEQEILDLAWEKLKGNIGTWAEEKLALPSVLNTLYSPSDW
jgi:hypothetical protein